MTKPLDPLHKIVVVEFCVGTPVILKIKLSSSNLVSSQLSAVPSFSGLS